MKIFHLFIKATLLLGLSAFALSIQVQADNCPWIQASNQTDTDGDGVGDVCDNCVATPNGPTLSDAGGNSQYDSDSDGYGNACDGDFTNDGVVDFADLSFFPGTFFKQEGDPGFNPAVDINGDKLVDFADISVFQRLFWADPGPTALAPDSNNAGPVADAGPEQTVPLTATVMLDGSGSTDADNEELIYGWILDSAPEGTNAALSDSFGQQPSFMADMPGTYEFTLTVVDGTAIDTDTVTINAVNGDPGEDQEIYLSWSRPTENSDGSTLNDLAGYRLYFGQNYQSNCLNYPDLLDINDPDNVSTTIDGLDSGTWYFGGTAYDISGNESICSNIAARTIP